MEKTEKNRFRFGLIGRDIGYSFSKGYFTEKFSKLQLRQHSYENFDLKVIDDLKTTLDQNKDIHGLNVTIPYKEAIIPFLNEIDPQAEKIGAVNTIKFTAEGLRGYNTDAYGFQNSLEPLLKKHHKKALILGTGGASKAIAYVFDEIGIDFSFVSRNPSKNQLSYTDLVPGLLEEYLIIINSTPLGTYPDVEKKPKIPYEHITSKHLLFDLIYNPEKTTFLKEGESRGATIFNGLAMLELQAEKAWEIWNSLE